MGKKSGIEKEHKTELFQKIKKKGFSIFCCIYSKRRAAFNIIKKSFNSNIVVFIHKTETWKAGWSGQQRSTKTLTAVLKTQRNAQMTQLIYYILQCM